MRENIKIRQYYNSDKETLINILKLNTPQYFAPSEENDFIFYLDYEIELYYVVLFDDKIIGCAGINFSENKKHGKLSWGLLHPDFQRKGIGTQLLKHRIHELSLHGVEKITVRTSQLAYEFFEKNNFILKETKKDYWAKDIDMYYMEYQINTT